MKLKVIKHEEVNGKLIVTVEVRRWWSNPITRQFIESGKLFEKHPNEDPAWLNYPDFTTVGWFYDPEAKFHTFLTGWKKYYDFHKTTTNGKTK